MGKDQILRYFFELMPELPKKVLISNLAFLVVLAATELIYFIAAGMVLCLGVRVKM